MGYLNDTEPWYFDPIDNPPLYIYQGDGTRLRIITRTI